MGCSVSVVVTAHDVEPWIGPALESLLAQRTPGLEVIVVEDHSTDGTAAIVGAAAERDARFRVVRPRDRGGANARNVGVEHATGTFIAFCDGDDMVPLGAYDRLLDGVTSDRTDIVFGGFERFDDQGSSRSTTHLPSFATPLRDVSIDDHADLLRNRACWNKLFRRSTWRDADVAFRESPRANDIVAVLSACLAADRISLVTDDVYRYRTRPGQSSMTARSSSADSFVGYLDQELLCREIVVASGRDALIAEHADIAIGTSGWGQLRRYASTTDAISGEVAGAAARFVSALGAPLSRAARPRRLLWRLTADRSDLAPRVARLLGPTDDPIASVLEWSQIAPLLPGPTASWHLDTREALTMAVAQVPALTTLPSPDLPDAAAAIHRLADAALQIGHPLDSFTHVAKLDEPAASAVRAAIAGDTRGFVDRLSTESRSHPEPQQDGRRWWRRAVDGGR